MLAKLPPGIQFPRYPERHFKAGEVMKWLLKGDENLRNVQEVLFAGLCAWALAPEQGNFIRDAMVLKSAKLAGKSERGALKQPEFDQQVVADLVVRVKKSLDLFSLVYYPIGGISAVIRAARFGSLSARFRRRTRLAVEVTRLVAIWHFVQDEAIPQHHSKHPDRKAINPPSKKLGFELLRELGKQRATAAKHPTDTRSSSRPLRDRWSGLQRSAALLYAASSISLNASESLFDRLLTGKLALGEARPHLDTWLQRAKYIDEQIIRKQRSKTPWKGVFPTKLLQQKFSPEGLSQAEKDLVASRHHTKKYAAEIRAKV